MSIAAIVVLFALLLVARARRQGQGDNTQPETGWEIAHQLGRVADALERLSLSPESQPSEVQSPVTGGGSRTEKSFAGFLTQKCQHHQRSTSQL